MNASGIVTPNSVLIDSSFLFALNNPKDKSRESVLQIARQNYARQIIPDIVLAETAYMLRYRVGQAAVINFTGMMVSQHLNLNRSPKLICNVPAPLCNNMPMQISIWQTAALWQ